MRMTPDQAIGVRILHDFDVFIHQTQDPESQGKDDKVNPNLPRCKTYSGLGMSFHAWHVGTPVLDHGFYLVFFLSVYTVSTSYG